METYRPVSPLTASPHYSTTPSHNNSPYYDEDDDDSDGEVGELDGERYGASTWRQAGDRDRDKDKDTIPTAKSDAPSVSQLIGITVVPPASKFPPLPPPIPPSASVPRPLSTSSAQLLPAPRAPTAQPAAAAAATLGPVPTTPPTYASQHVYASGLSPPKSALSPLPKTTAEPLSPPPPPPPPAIADDKDREKQINQFHKPRTVVWPPPSRPVPRTYAPNQVGIS